MDVDTDDLNVLVSLMISDHILQGIRYRKVRVTHATGEHQHRVVTHLSVKVVSFASVADELKVSVRSPGFRRRYTPMLGRRL